MASLHFTTYLPPGWSVMPFSSAVIHVWYTLLAHGASCTNQSLSLRQVVLMTGMDNGQRTLGTCTLKQFTIVASWFSLLEKVV